MTYLGPDVVKRRWADDGEADKEDVGLGIGQWAQAVVILLASGIPQPQADGLPVDHDAGGVVVEAGRVSAATTCCAPDLHGGDVFAREGIGGVGYQEACLRWGQRWTRTDFQRGAYLSNGSIASYHTLRRRVKLALGSCRDQIATPMAHLEGLRSWSGHGCYGDLRVGRRGAGRFARSVRGSRFEVLGLRSEMFMRSGGEASKGVLEGRWTARWLEVECFDTTGDGGSRHAHTWETAVQRRGGERARCFGHGGWGQETDDGLSRG